MDEERKQAVGIASIPLIIGVIGTVARASASTIFRMTVLDMIQATRA